MDCLTDPENPLRLFSQTRIEAAKEDAVEPVRRLLSSSQQDMIMWTWEMAEKMQNRGRISEVFFAAFSISAPTTRFFPEKQSPCGEKVLFFDKNNTQKQSGMLTHTFNLSD
ncbi:Hypothetical predicted protein [Marmota monax]|uniref:Uncharacterized protein n=1 Tax=Marmota monax TaxID=9995 RepID=A0A5E4CMZ5_MARMO|nr:hypothetical protein GHT09_012185 [Marmota monax]VTJ83218.1 Hypothetical predicted protein [Marmota monax]